MIKKVLKKLTAAVLAAVTVVTAIPAVAGSIKSNSQDIQTLSYQNEAVNDNDISYETATFVNFDAAAWTFINAAKKGTWMYIKSYKNSNQLMQPVNYEGTYVNLWGGDGAYKQWQFEAHEDYFYIKNMNTGKYLWFDALKNGAAVNAETVNPGWNNRFKLVTDQKTLTFSIRTYADTKYCVEIGGRDSSMPQQNDKIQIWTYEGLQNQKWNITVDDGEQLNGTLIYDIQNNPQGSSDYNYPKNGVIRGMAQTMIDKMDFKFNSIKTAYDLFGDVDANTSYGGLSVYQEVNSGYKFPFKIDEDGYRYFDSKEMYVTKNDSEKKFNLYNGSYDVMYHDVTSQYDRAVSNAFVPYNTPNFTDMDYGFTMCMEIKFFMENDGKVHVYDENGNETEQSMIFEFTGDDDLWIYIDDKLCLDMGGIHGAKRGNINFESRTARTYFDSGDVNTEQKFDLASGEHTLRVFYMERAQTESNLKVKYNLISKNNLKIDPNGGTYKGRTGITDLGERLSNEQIRIQKPSRKGYVFAGWDVQGSGRLTTDNSFYYMGYNDTTLVAQWEPNQYNLNFDYNKPQDAAADITGNDITTKKVLYTKTVGELPSPALKGYTFTGWQDENGKIYTEDTIYDTEGDTVLYAQWDAAPVIHAIDRYYTLTSANNGRITRENLMSTASVTDDKDNTEDIEFKIADYSENDFKNLTADAQISITYKAVDSAGNKTYKKVFVHIVDTTPKKIEKTTYVRHISEKYYDKAFEDGGLEPDSIWRKNPEYAATLKRAMENRASITYAKKKFRFLWRDYEYTDYGEMSVDHIQQHWEFTKEDRDKIREFVDEHGVGNSKEPDALKKFYETFGYCRKY